MAKMRISALAKELGFENCKPILDLLNVDGKNRKAQSNIDDDEISSVRAHFAPAPSGEPKKSDDRENTKNKVQEKETKAAGEASSEEGGASARKTAAQPPARGDRKPSPAPGSARPKKRPNLVFVSNNSGGQAKGGSKGSRQAGQLSQGGIISSVSRGDRQQRGQVDSDTVRAAFARSLGEKIPEVKKPPVKQEPAPAPAQVRQDTPAAGENSAPKAEEKKIVATPEKAAAEVAPKPAMKPAKSTAGQTPKAAPAENRPQVRAADNTDRQIRGPKVLRHEEIQAQPDRRKGRDTRGRNDFEQESGNGGKRNVTQKGGISFSSNGSAGRFGDNRPSGQRRDGGKGPGSQTGSKTFIAGPAAKGGKGRDRRKDDKRRDFERDDDQQVRTKKANPHGFHKPEKVEKEEEKIKVITLPEKVTIRDLAEKMKIQPAQILKKLLLAGNISTLNSELTYEEAENIAIEYDIICEQEEKVDVIAELLKEDEEDESRMVRRPPVVCVMGHVDHGKTSLLDAIRKSNVTDREAGGITQHIGAYTVNLDGNNITFLDTPGHEAFTAMRMRGANSTDIAILVVAADDGVMPQTVEAINHAKAAGIEIIVAVNKIDKPNANVDRVKQELAEYELIPEDWGGSTVFAPVSAKTGQGIQELLEMVILTSDILELKADPVRKARGLVIEAELDKGRGPVATMLVQKGTLHVGDFIAAGATHGKVRAMIDDKGRRVKEAGPSTPVEILGLNDVPAAGDVFISPDNDKEAKHFADTFIEQNRLKLVEDTKQKQRMTLDDVFSQIQEGNLKELNIIVKADVQGSVEAVKTSLLKLSNEEVVVKVIHSGVGAINESDVSLASASNAIIIGFNVRIDSVAKNTSETEGVDVRLYKVIYQAIEDVEAAMKGMLDAVYEEKVIGHAEVRQIFKASGIGNIAGAYVLDGVFERGCKVRISREGEQLFEGDLASLKRFKDDVKEVKAGFECGLVFDGWGEMQELDIVEAYKMVEVPR